MATFTFSELTPSAFLERSGRVFPDRPAITDGDLRFTYAEFLDRCRRLTGLLADLGIAPGDRVAALCVNSHVLLELHNGVPMRGAVLVPLNIRLSVEELTYIVGHSGARVLVTTHELHERAERVAAGSGARLVVAGEPGDEYEALLAHASPRPVTVTDERAMLAINYTSGTTAQPKGVVYHHRGAYLQALAMAWHAGLTAESGYLWTLPMFHCNGWCFTWAVTAAGAHHLCLRSIDTARIWDLIAAGDVTHFSAAPTVLTMIAAAAQAPGPASGRHIQVQTGGAPPSPTLLARTSALGLDVTHLYGLTETFGPIAINQWQPEWSRLPAADQAARKARQGVANVIGDQLRVVNPAGDDVPADGSTIGEIVVRGNDVMLGYYLDDEATAAATVDGWLRTGDLAVMHPDGYVDIRDRAKDIIISGGENIASVEVERVIDALPGVVESAVVARADPTWGEVPIAYVTVASGADVTEADIIAHVRNRLAHFKTPRHVVFGELPKTSTGKIQKNILRTRR